MSVSNHTVLTQQSEQIASKIVIIRGVQVLIDRDLAEMYGVETKRLKEQVNRNSERFPEAFMFQLNDEEIESLSSRSQIATLNKNGNRRGSNIKYNPYAFTEQGVAMLSAVLRSERAIKVSIEIMNAFVQMRHILLKNANISSQLKSLESRVDSRLLEHDIKLKEYDKNFAKIFDAIESKKISAKEGIFFQGQIFDAYSFFQNLIQGASKSIILIDGYVDLSVLERFSKKKPNVSITIYTHPKTEISDLDAQRFNDQYPTLVVKHTKKMHDRFLIIDNKELYHIGASLKDLGKACFAFEKMEDSKTIISAIMENLR